MKNYLNDCEDEILHYLACGTDSFPGITMLHFKYTDGPVYEFISLPQFPVVDRTPIIHSDCISYISEDVRDDVDALVKAVFNYFITCQQNRISPIRKFWLLCRVLRFDSTHEVRDFGMSPNAEGEVRGIDGKWTYDGLWCQMEMYRGKLDV